MPFYNPFTGYAYSVDPATGALAAVLVPVPGGHVALSTLAPTLSSVPFPTMPTFGKDMYGMAEEVPHAREESMQVDHIVDVVDSSDEEEDWETELFGSFEETEDRVEAPACLTLPAGWVPPIRPLETFDWSILTSTTVPEKRTPVTKVACPVAPVARLAQAVRPVTQAVRPVARAVRPNAQAVRPIVQTVFSAAQAALAAPKVVHPTPNVVHPTADTPRRLASATSAFSRPAATIDVSAGVQPSPYAWTMGSRPVQAQPKLDARIRTPTRAKANRMRTDPVARADLRSVPDPRRAQELMPIGIGSAPMGIGSAPMGIGSVPMEDMRKPMEDMRKPMEDMRKPMEDMRKPIASGRGMPTETAGRTPIGTMRTTPVNTRRKISGPTALMDNRTVLSKAALAPAALSQATAVTRTTTTTTLAQATMAYGDAGTGMMLWANHAGIDVTHGYPGTEFLVGWTRSLQGDPRLPPRVKTDGVTGLKRHLEYRTEGRIFGDGSNTYEDDNPLAKRLKAIHISRDPAYDTRKFAPPTADQRRREERRRAQAAAMVYRMPHFALL
ncbi:hypothetical protein C8Q78DRAFT_833326 [Trametes maxima]|nr:hypothetical protein C8Q78DRAFT_833326 [Trametes maxima]